MLPKHYYHRQGISFSEKLQPLLAFLGGGGARGLRLTEVDAKAKNMAGDAQMQRPQQQSDAHSQSTVGAP